jgi:type II secretory pathway pseudopilin PulG
MHARNHVAAYTLVEVLVVVLVLMIIAAIVVPSLVPGQDSQVTSAARIVASDLETARSMAVTTLVPHSLVFSDDLTAYKVAANYGGGDYASAVAIAHPVRVGSDYVVVPAAQNGMAGVTVVAVDFGGRTYVTFNSQGEPSSPGSITLRAGQFQVAVSVEVLTGNITVSNMTD